MNARPLLIALSIAGGPLAAAQEGLYFPPTTGNAWETVTPQELGWCADQLPALHDFLEQSNTKAFLVLKNGRLVVEWYFGTFTTDSVWYWASAGKSLTAFLVGRAQQEGFLSTDDPASQYLGAGWTSLPPGQEEAITVWHQLTMTSGLDDGMAEPDCTDPECLQFLAPPGTRWAYHNAPYTLLDGVLENATGLSLNAFLFTRLTQPTGISGLYAGIGYNNVFFSRPRSMARFGLLMQGGGTWNGVPVLNDPDYHGAMIAPSQALNESYGYLWWLNGQASFMYPGVPLPFPGPLMTNAPMDVYAALGKNGQIINVAPSEGLVVVRMGDLPGGIFVPNLYNDQIWQYLNAVMCGATEVREHNSERLQFLPNPMGDRVEMVKDANLGTGEVTIMDGQGRTVLTRHIVADRAHLDVSGLANGCYVATFRGKGGTASMRLLKQ